MSESVVLWDCVVVVAKRIRMDLMTFLPQENHPPRLAVGTGGEAIEVHA
jgi:hypothetical protein